MTPADQWNRYQKHLCTVTSLELTVDVSRMRFDDDFFLRMEPEMQRAYAAMEELEKGDISNKDEGRMVGHYWLRSPDLAPSTELIVAIDEALSKVKCFAKRVHSGEVRPPQADRFTGVLCIGIGGSALGPMFVSDALGQPGVDRMRIDFLDNTDPDGIARVLASLAERLDQTLCIVTSKSGSTPETRNGMVLAATAYTRAGLEFAKHAVAITGVGSKLDKQAEAEGWLARFPMFDWVGGRTSETSAVGLLPAALQGLDIAALLQGAAACDSATRVRETAKNPAALLALMWYHGTSGKGSKDMVVLPYKDRLLLFSRYLQQLVMESLGKGLDLAGNPVEQGIAVYGNKGSTDQHAYVQQLREGVNNFFVTFIRVLEAGGDGEPVEPGVTAGDYLHGFLLGTREALASNGRESMTITIRRVDAFAVGALIALFERAVGFYATLVNINAYHQPGVEAGKKAAEAVLNLQKEIADNLGEPATASELAAKLNASDVERVYLILEHLAANGRVAQIGEGPEARFGVN